MHISEFKKGDIITRAKPARYGDPRRAHSFIGDKIEYLGHTNGVIDIKLLQGNSFNPIAGTTFGLNIDLWGDGWEEYKEIDGETPTDTWLILDDIDNEKKSTKDLLKQSIQGALEKEDYEFLSELKDLFNKLTE